MDPITLILSTVGTIVNKIFPDKTESEKQRFILELQKQLSETDILKSQLEINKAEAANPNRKWVSWRELIGYICAFSFGWTYLLQPVITYCVVIAGYPAPNLPALDMTQLMLLLGTMLGVGGLKSYEAVKSITKTK